MSFWGVLGLPALLLALAPVAAADIPQECAKFFAPLNESRLSLVQAYERILTAISETFPDNRLSEMLGADELFYVPGEVPSQTRHIQNALEHMKRLLEALPEEARQKTQEELRDVLRRLAQRARGSIETYEKAQQERASVGLVVVPGVVAHQSASKIIRFLPQQDGRVGFFESTPDGIVIRAFDLGSAMVTEVSIQPGFAVWLALRPSLETVRGDFFLARQSENDEVFVFDLPKDKLTSLKWTKRSGEYGMRSPRFSPSGRYLVFHNAESSSAYILDLMQKTVTKFTAKDAKGGGLGYGSPNHAFAFTPGEASLIHASHDGLVQEWDLKTGTLLNTLVRESWKDHRGALLSWDGQFVFYMENSGEAVRINLRTNDRITMPLRPPAPSGDYTESYHFSPSGRYAIATTRRGPWVVADLDLGRVAQIQPPSQSIGESSIFSPNEKMLYVSNGKEIHSWDVEKLFGR